MARRAFWQRLLGRRKPRTVGLALSGGGARGLAHIGVLKVLERESLPIHFLAGTSMGGLLAAASAAGFSAAELEQEALAMGSTRQLIGLLDLTFPRGGLLTGQKAMEYLERLLGDVTFDRLRIPLAVVAVDLDRGQKVVIREGSVVEAVRATTALPGVFAPVRQGDGRLVDGGLLDNLPADVVRQMGADVVIAVDAGSDRETIAAFSEALHRIPLLPDGIEEMIEVLWRSMALLTQEVNRRVLAEARPDLLLDLPIPPDISVLGGLTRAAEVIAIGERAAEESLPRIRELLDG